MSKPKKPRLFEVYGIEERKYAVTYQVLALDEQDALQQVNENKGSLVNEDLQETTYERFINAHTDEPEPEPEPETPSVEADFVNDYEEE